MIENSRQPASTRRSSVLMGLEAGRGVAATMVVTGHTWVHTRQFYGYFPFGKFFEFGHAGVDFFFVLSGFIIFHAHRRDIGMPARLVGYVERRLTRIYPLYWIMLALTLVAVGLSSHPMPDLREIFTSAFLLPTMESPILDVAWTLQQEMLFYAIFALLILNRRLGVIVFACWLAFLTANAFSMVPRHWGPVVKLGFYFNFEFFLGMGAAWLTAQRRIPAPGLTILAGLAVFLAVGFSEDAEVVRNASIFTHLGYGIGALAVVLGLVTKEQDGALVIPRPLAILGSASYSIYLVHLLVIGAIWQLLVVSGLDSRIPASAAFLVLAAGATAGGVSISYLVEKPVIALVRRHLKTLTTSRNPPGSAVKFDAVKP